MTVLARCWEIVQKERECCILTHGPTTTLFHIRGNLKYTTKQTEAEATLYEEEQAQTLRQELKDLNKHVSRGHQQNDPEDDVCGSDQPDEPCRDQSEDENQGNEARCAEEHADLERAK